MPGLWPQSLTPHLAPLQTVRYPRVRSAETIHRTRWKCGQPMTNRVCFQLQVRPERISEYREWHLAVWPEMLRALKQTGWSNYSLFLRPDGLLIGYLETADLPAAQAGMAATEVNARWQAQMGDFFADVDGTPDAGFLQLTEMFNLEDQLAALDVAPRERSSS
jgi:L-rhamnose mutarotase